MAPYVVVAVSTLLALSLPITPSNSLPQAEQLRVRIETDLGAFEVDLEAGRAPVTVANFLRYVDAGHYDGGVFHRTVTLDNQVRDDILIEVVRRR
jgi:peptidyl-prolyl cis-trans isomerase A (cyclophilin A)